jgi:regulator of sirC expression with transglutaminase-like and TPR domain
MSMKKIMLGLAAGSMALLAGLNFPSGFAAAPAPEQAVSGKARSEAITVLERMAAKDNPSESFQEIVLATGRVLDPQLDADAVKAEIAAMAGEVRTQVGAEAPARAQAEAMSRVIFQAHGFGRPDTSAPIISGKNGLNLYMLHRFIKTRKAHCEGLSSLYFLVGEAAGLPVSLCNAPIHTYCRLGKGADILDIECTQGGRIRAKGEVQRINGATPAAASSLTYFHPLNKKQFIAFQINALAYGLAVQPEGPAPLDKGQMVRLAKLMETLDPDRPESLDTAALIYFQNGDPAHAATIAAHVVSKALELGTTPEVMAHFREMQKKYTTAAMTD